MLTLARLFPPVAGLDVVAHRKLGCMDARCCAERHKVIAALTLCRHVTGKGSLQLYVTGNNVDLKGFCRSGFVREPEKFRFRAGQGGASALAARRCQAGSKLARL